MREAEAWRAVLGLHAATVGAVQQVFRAEEKAKEHFLYTDERTMNSEARESSYCCSLTGLANQCDNLHSECLKLRALRKSRRAVEAQCLAEIMRPSSDEIMAMGQSLASNAALNLSSATSEVRLAIQQQRSQVSQLRAFLETARTCSTLPLPRGSHLVVGVERGSEQPRLHRLDSVLQEIYTNSRDLNESSLSEALSRMFSDRAPESCADPNSRQFARRSADRG